MTSRSLFLALVLALSPGLAGAQDVPTIQELEYQYRAQLQLHQSAFDAWRALELGLARALAEFTAASEAGATNQRDQAFTDSQRLGSQVGLQAVRVGEYAEEVRRARSALLAAHTAVVDSLIQLVESTQDPAEREELTAILADRNNRVMELRGEEDPETTLEPMQEFTIGPRDTPEIILAKAEALEERANRREVQLAEARRRLEELRQDQRRARTVRDFMAGLERYDDTRLPVVSPGSRTTTQTDPEQVPPGADTLGVEERPMTLEERIESLEIFESGLEQRIQQIRDKAERFRQAARRGV